MFGFDPTEKAASQIPALQLLSTLGFEIETQDEIEARRGKLSRVLLEDVLAERILDLNVFTRRGEQYRFDRGDGLGYPRPAVPGRNARLSAREG